MVEILLWKNSYGDHVHRIGQSRPVKIHVPMAIHPEYQEHSFDYLLHSLMRRSESSPPVLRYGRWATLTDAELQRMVAEVAGSGGDQSRPPRQTRCLDGTASQRSLGRQMVHSHISDLDLTLRLSYPAIRIEVAAGLASARASARPTAGCPDWLPSRSSLGENVGCALRLMVCGQ